MKSIIITKNDSDQRLDKFLKKTLKNLPISLLYKYIRTKSIKVNNKRTSISYKLKKGDIISLYIKDEFFIQSPDKYDFLKAPVNLKIVYEDENIMLVDKPVGLIVHPDENYHFDSLISRILHYMYIKGEYNPKNENSFVPALVNRIDRNTSGIVIAAKNFEALKILNEKIKNRELNKYYLTLVHGTFKKKESTLKAYLEKNESQNRVYISEKPKPNYKTILTKYKVIKEYQNYSLLEIELLTGRTHQIRAHMAFIGHPIMGDGKYGTNKINKNINYKQQALCSYKLVFNFKSNSGILEYLNHKEFKVNSVWFLKDFNKLLK